MDTKGLYVVVEPFKVGAAYFEAGKTLSTEELSSIRLYKIKLNEGKIVPLSSLSKDKFNYYSERARLRWGTDFKANVAKRVSKGSDSAATSNTPKLTLSTPTGTNGEAKADLPTTGAGGFRIPADSTKGSTAGGNANNPSGNTTKPAGGAANAPKAPMTGTNKVVNTNPANNTTK